MPPGWCVILTMWTRSGRGQKGKGWVGYKVQVAETIVKAPDPLRIISVMPSNTPIVPSKADPGLSLEEMKTFVRNHFEDFVGLKIFRPRIWIGPALPRRAFFAQLKP